ncbi:MAG: hypothetical protein J5958_00915 [Clostridia bacterium]|nr:hypothetical protein [Clostridia bacterium]
MKRILAILLALLLLTASLVSCSIQTAGSTKTTVPITDAATREIGCDTRKTDAGTEPPPADTSDKTVSPVVTTAATTSPPPAVTTAKPEPPPATTAEPDLPTEDPEDQYYTKNY